MAKVSSEGLDVKRRPEQVHKDIPPVWDSGDGSVKCLLCKHEEFDPQHTWKRPGEGHQGGRDGRSSGAYQPVSLAQLASLSPRERPCLNKKVDGT